MNLFFGIYIFVPLGRVFSRRIKKGGKDRVYYQVSETPP